MTLRHSPRDLHHERAWLYGLLFIFVVVGVYAYALHEMNNTPYTSGVTE